MIDSPISAKIEVKTEIPTHASGRLAHQIADAISPITEFLGLQGDKMRIHRMVSVQKTLERAHKLIKGMPTKPVPLKVAVPLLENASQEDPIDEFMIDRWATLLASATQEESVSPYFVTLLSNLNSRQARLFLDFTEPKRLFELRPEQLRLLKNEARKLLRSGASAVVIGQGLEELLRNASVFPLMATWEHQGGAGAMETFIKGKVSEIFMDLRILDSLRLISWLNFTDAFDQMTLNCQYCALTPLGDQFRAAVSRGTAQSIALT